MPDVLRRPVLALQAAVGAVDAYLLVLLAAAARASAPPAGLGGEPLSFAVIVPAHDEEAGIDAAVRALRALDFPADRVRLLVVADNCTDRTAEVARRAGVTVLERHEPLLRGKGHALNWVLDRLHDVAPETEAIAFVDADCEASPGLLRALDARLRSGASAVQASYVVANAGASTASTLRAAAFSLFNVVRPLGKDRLGLSAGILGTGMALRRDLVERHRFDTGSVVEDADLHLRLVAAGERVVFAPEAEVRSAMPTAAPAAAAQQTRWEGGRFELLRAHLAPLLRDGVRRRDPVRVHAAFELLVPPQSILAMLHGAVVVLGPLAGRRALSVGLAELAAQAVFVLGGLRVAGAPREFYRALAGAPALIAQKLRVFGGMARTGAPKEWERTAR